MKAEDIMRELEKQGVKVEGISKEHKQQIEDYLGTKVPKDEDSNMAKDKPSVGEGAKPTK